MVGTTTGPDKAALLAEIAATRVQFTRASERFRESMDLSARLRRNLQEHRARWVAGASVTALLLVVLLRRRKKIVYVERSTGDFLGAAGKAGILLTGLKLLSGLAKPLIGEVAKTRLLDLAAGFARSRFSRGGAQSRQR